MYCTVYPKVFIQNSVCVRERGTRKGRFKKAADVVKGYPCLRWKVHVPDLILLVALFSRGHVTYSVVAQRLALISCRSWTGIAS